MLDTCGLRSLLDAAGAEAIGFHDFRRNGLLLPASIDEALRLGLRLHRGPHHGYNELVIERMGQIEAGWQKRRRGRAGRPADAHAGDRAMIEALMRIDLLQRALRRRLLDPANWRGARLNARDPALDFSHLDQMADRLWSATTVVEA